MALIIMALLFLRFFIWLIPEGKKQLENLMRQMKKKFRVKRNGFIFDQNYIEVKAFYLQEYKTLPCISFMDELDVAKVYDYIDKGYAGKVLATYQRNYYNWSEKRQEFTATIFKLEKKVMIKLGYNSAEILFADNNYAYSNELVKVFSVHKVPEKQQDFEINIITHTSSGLELKSLDIKPTLLDIDLYYNDDFKMVDQIIRERLTKQNDKGIILLHGLPGTGKTTYLRHLIGTIQKRVLFVSPGVACNLMNPEFMDLLIDNPNAVLIIEDAENVIMDRKFSSHSSVSNLLNISDGLLSDCLNVQIICTFNSDINMVDDALLRKGRLIAKYEFGKLNAGKAKRLSDHLGFAKEINRAMTIAEITNPGDMDVIKPPVQVMGFRREAVMN